MRKKSNKKQNKAEIAVLQSLKTYEDWKHCITKICDIPLTPTYVEQRLVALRDPSDNGTKKFVATWGEAHLERVIGWFKQAQRELNGS